MPARQPRARLSALGILVVWLASPALPAASPPVDPTYGADGLTGLAVGGVPVLVQGRPAAAKVVLASGHRDPATMPDPYVTDERTFVDGPVEVQTQAFDPAGKRLRQSFAWGTIDTRYAAGPGVLVVRVDIENTSPQTIEQLVLDLLAIRVPARAALSPAVTNLGFPALAAVVPRVTRFQRAAFPAAAVDDLLAELDADTKPEVRVMCPACYAKAAQEHLMETERQPEPLGTVVDGTCSRCKAETHLPQEPLIVATCPQPNRPLALAWEARQPGTAVLVVTSGDRRSSEPFDGVWAARPIKPGAKDTIEIELRFGRADEQPVAIAAATYEAFARAHPQRLAWPDRRPISMAHLCFDRGPDRNPRGWWGFKDTTDDIRTPEGRAAFETWIMVYADQLIDVADKAGAQGVVIWDLEGKQFPGQAYYGDPRLMRFTAPEMEAVADAFCAKLRDAGLRVGMCLRPTRIEPLGRPGANARGSWETFDPDLFDPQFEHFDELGVAGAATLADPARSPVERLDEKIRFCKQRWGATLFYVDSNYFARSRKKSAANAAGGFDTLSPPERLMMQAADWEELQRRHPDVLLIPEHEYGQYWASTAPYRQPPYDGPTPADVRAAYPEACSAIALNGEAEQHVEKARAAYVSAVEQGDLLMLPGWYGPPRVVTDIYAAAAVRAPVAVELAADGRITLQGRPVKDVAALEEQAAAAVRGRPFAERRTVIRSAPTSRRPDRAAVIAALERAGAVIAWSQPSAGGAR